MKITLLVVGKTTDAHIEALLQDYQKRLVHYVPFNIAVIPELKNTKSLTSEQQKQAEGELICHRTQEFHPSKVVSPYARQGRRRTNGFRFLLHSYHDQLRLTYLLPPGFLDFISNYTILYEYLQLKYLFF